MKHIDYKGSYVYPAIFERAEGEASYTVTFPDFDNCVTCGASITAAINMARERLGIEIELYEDEKMPLPANSNIEDFKKPVNGFVSLIDIDMVRYHEKHNSDMVRKNCTVQRWLNDMAEARHINFSAILQEGLREKLGI